MTGHKPQPAPQASIELLLGPKVPDPIQPWPPPWSSNITISCFTCGWGRTLKIWIWWIPGSGNNEIWRPAGERSETRWKLKGIFLFWATLQKIGVPRSIGRTKIEIVFNSCLIGVKPIGRTGTTWEHVATKMFDANIMKNIENFTALKIRRFKKTKIFVWSRINFG
jgi:hypothetical protein